MILVAVMVNGADPLLKAALCGLNRVDGVSAKSAGGVRCVDMLRRP